MVFCAQEASESKSLVRSFKKEKGPTRITELSTACLGAWWLVQVFPRRMARGRLQTPWEMMVGESRHSHSTSYRIKKSRRQVRGAPGLSITR